MRWTCVTPGLWLPECVRRRRADKNNVRARCDRPHQFAPPAAEDAASSYGDYTGGNESSVGKRASTGGGDILGSGSKAGRDQYTGNTQKTEVASSGAPRTRTPEQKAATKAKREEKKAANPAYNTKNPNRPPKADSPIKKTTNPAGPKKGNNVTQVQEMGAMKQKSTVGGNF